jgi:pyruvate/2-oxoglutarate dehydrogenase complex dihydrolipoamide dehydrogenase (E3) component
VGKLNLESAGVEHDRSGVMVNGYLQTTNRRIYAAGDVGFPYKFTHMAEATARIVVQNALFLKSKKWKSLIVPWVTYTDPEIAHVGMYEKDARKKGIEVDTYIKHFNEVDRAILDGETEGFIKVHTVKGKDKIVGATIVARHAGDMISEINAAMTAGKGLKMLANVIHPYPTQADGIKQVAGQVYAGMLTPRRRRLLERFFAFKR